MIIEYQGQRNIRWDLKDLNAQEMRINITMPALEKIEATGYGTIRFDEFSGEDMEIDTRGPIRIRGDMNVQSLRVNLTGNFLIAQAAGNIGTLFWRPISMVLILLCLASVLAPLWGALRARKRRVVTEGGVQ